jgi:hypothetical protein
MVHPNNSIINAVLIFKCFGKLARLAKFITNKKIPINRIKILKKFMILKLKII